MKLCLSYHFMKFVPKGDVLQFLILLRAVDEKVTKLSAESSEEHVIDCVLPFDFMNGQDGFSFQNVRFHSCTNIASKIVELDEKVGYDFIFIRGRKEALELIEKSRKAADKLLHLAIQYKLDDPQIMDEVLQVFEHARITFFQSLPWAERFKSYICERGTARETADRKIKVLPQYVERMNKEMISSISPSSPMQLILPGVIRSRYGLPVALQAVRLIREQFPDVYLHLVYPTIAKPYREASSHLIDAPEMINHGLLTMWETKRKILEAGIGMALIYDDTPDNNPTYCYLSRILEYMSLGIPFITTRTVGNRHLLGEDYPLFVEDEQDIYRCYLRLQDPAFYREVSRLVSQLGRPFLADVAVEDFWAVLEHEKMEKRGKPS